MIVEFRNPLQVPNLRHTFSAISTAVLSFDSVRVAYGLFNPAPLNPSIFNFIESMSREIYVFEIHLSVSIPVLKELQSSQRPTPCGAYRDRTDDLRLAKPALSQLS